MLSLHRHLVPVTSLSLIMDLAKSVRATKTSQAARTAQALNFRELRFSGNK